jgi:predicted ATPase
MAPSGRHSLAVGYTFDPRVTSLGYLAFILLALGHPDRALARSREALAEARGLAHPVTLALALHLACLLWQFARDARAVRERAEALVALAAEQGFPFWAAYGAVLRGWALAAQEGCTGEGIEQMRRGVAAYRTTGSELWVPHFLALAADVHARAGRATEGLGLLDEALARVEATGERWVEAELHRLRGELLRSSAERDRAEACFHRALAVAREQGARMWELRAATSLARLQRDQGRRDDARTLLAPIYGWFTEGFDTADLKDAKALLEELA